MGKNVIGNDHNLRFLTEKRTIYTYLVNIKLEDDVINKESTFPHVSLKVDITKLYLYDDFYCRRRRRKNNEEN